MSGSVVYWCVDARFGRVRQVRCVAAMWGTVTCGQVRQAGTGWFRFGGAWYVMLGRGTAGMLRIGKAWPSVVRQGRLGKAKNERRRI